MPTAVGSAMASPWGTWVCSEAGQSLFGAFDWDFGAGGMTRWAVATTSKRMELNR